MFSPSLIDSLNVLQASLPELNLMIDEKLDKHMIVTTRGWTGPLCEPELKVVRESAEIWVAAFNTGHPPQLALPESRADMSEEKFRARLKAKWFLEAIELRYRTLLRVAKVLVEAEHDFLERGPKHLQGQDVAEVAEACGIHESTVGRTVTNKSIATPWGVFELATFLNC